ncbi:MAG: hypothetical protein WAO35_21150 [Terriglobia bacterium]
MKNYFLAFILAVFVVLSGVSIRRSVAGIGGTPAPIPPMQGQAVDAFGIGGTPAPIPPMQGQAIDAFGIGGTPAPIPPMK